MGNKIFVSLLSKFVSYEAEIKLLTIFMMSYLGLFSAFDSTKLDDPTSITWFMLDFFLREKEDLKLAFGPDALSTGVNS